MIKKLLIALVVIIMSATLYNPAFAQIGDRADIIKSGTHDANVLTEAYLKPYIIGFNAAMASGWASSPRTMDVLGFDITFTAGLALVPSGDKTFRIDRLDLERTVLRDADANVRSPTASGVNTRGPVMEVYENGLLLHSFRLPPGLGFGYVPAPIIQAGLGIPADTDVMLRFIPGTSVGASTLLSMYGIGFKHELNQWFDNDLPLDLALLVGYTRLTLNANVNVKPEPDDYVLGGENDTDLNWSRQKSRTTNDSYLISLIGGQELSDIFYAYGSIGMSSSNFRLKATGNYPLINAVPDPDNPGEYVPSLSINTDPLNIDVTRGPSFRISAGIKLDFDLISFNVDYTFTDYSTFNLGISFVFN
jgi:hypothetical protein